MIFPEPSHSSLERFGTNELWMLSTLSKFQELKANKIKNSGDGKGKAETQYLTINWNICDSLDFGCKGSLLNKGLYLIVVHHPFGQ